MGWRGSPQAQHGPTTAWWRWDGGSGMASRRDRNRPDKPALRPPPGGFHFLETGMPTVTLRYRLPDEQAEFDAARQGSEAKRVLWEIDQYLRGIVKHGDPSKETAGMAEEIRRMIRDSPERLLD